MSTRTFLLIPAMLCIGLQAGCASDPNVPQGVCHATGAQNVLGQPLNDQTIVAARAGATALRSRVLPLGSPPDTKEVDPLRLNLEVDASGVIQRMRCG
jgi:hypothetical protein